MLIVCLFYGRENPCVRIMLDNIIVENGGRMNIAMGGLLVNAGA